ncbi:MAG: glutamine amidotransferase [bacterium]|nr:glutamine amidotransferase [bacterium]
MPKIIFSPTIPVFIIIPLVILAGAITFYTYWRLTGRLRSILLSLRLAAIFVILFILLQPSISIIKEKIEKNNIIFLIDNSGSMGIADETGKDRLSRLKGLFKEKKNFSEMSKKSALSFYSFSNGLNEISLNDIDSLKINDSNTDFYRALSLINKKINIKTISGVFILSDGIDNDPENTLKLVKELPYPVFTISPGEEKILRDISIKLQNTPEKAFLDKKVTINFVINSFGFGTKTIFCVLKEDGNEIKKEKFRILPGKNILSLEFTPKKTGPHSYLISIPVEGSEAISKNNEEEFYLDVKKEKLYVLVLAGAPSPEYKFLHEYLIKEPDIKARFLVSKNKNDFIKLEENEGKDRFPEKKEELFEYDLIIFNDIERKKIPEYAFPWLKEFAGERGGGVLMLGGRNSFQGGGYNNSSLEDILPVVFNREEPLFNEGKFLFELTGSGKVHPVTQLMPDSIKNTQIWKELPVLEGYNIINKSKPGALVLAVRSVNKNDIIWAVQSYGRGRTMAIMANDLWRWDFLMTGIGKTSEYYERFFSRILSWLTSVKGDAFDIETDKFIYSPGEIVNLAALVYQKDLVSFQVTGFIKEMRSKNKDIINFISYGGNKGLLKAEYKPLASGEFEITAEANGNKGFIGKAVKKIFVKKDLTEWDNVIINDKFLKEISDKSHGKFYKANELDPLKLSKFKDDIKGREIMAKILYDLSLWDNIFIFCLFITLLASEWYLRKKKGLK